MAGPGASSIAPLSQLKKTATAVAGAASLNATVGVVTSEALTTAQDASYTLTITNTLVDANSVVVASVSDGTNTQGTTVITKVTPSTDSLVIIVTNKHATAQALNGTIKIAFAVVG